MSRLKQGNLMFARIFNLLNRSQKSKADHEETVKGYAKKEWKFILPEDKSEETSGSWPDFMTACCTGDVSKVTSQLQGDGMIDVNQQDDEGRTALILASKGGHTAIVKHLVKKGADIDIRTNTGKTALMKACKYGHINVAKILLDNNCGVNIVDHHGYSALLLASIHGHSEIAERLLKCGAEVNVLDKKGISSLIHASFGDHTSVVKTLLDHGATTDIIANIAAIDDVEDPMSALMIASLKRNLEIVKLLLTLGASVNLLSSEEGNSALQFASMGGSTEVVQMLIEHGALQSSTNGYKALMVASLYGHIEIVEMLLNCGVDVQTDISVDTPLSLACMSWRPQIVKLLLERGADPNTESIIAELCSECSDEDVDDFITNVPLFAKPVKPQNKEEVVKMLISSGKVNLEDRLDAFTDAHENEDKKLIKVLLHDDSANLLMEAIKCDRPDDIFALIGHGTKVNAKDSYGRTPLSLAMELGFQEIVDILLAFDAEINQSDAEERSALIQAIRNGNTNLAIDMIEQGAALDFQDVHGCSALMHAFKTENFKVVQLLVANGASIHLKDKKDSTRLDVWPEHEVATHQELLKTFLSMSNDNLDLDMSYPEIIFHKPLFAGKLNSSATTIGSIEDEGFVLQVLADSLTSATNFIICPCFSGPFELPDEYESASPAYLIHHDKMDLQKDVTIRMHHYASLQSEEDCEDMAFLSASSTPEYRGSRPVYTFKEIQGAKGVFRPGDQVGEISLRHFCIGKVGKKKKAETQEETKGDAAEKGSREIQCLYSARLYRNIQHKGDVTAIFCACLFSPLYIKHCDEVIMNEYTGMSNKGEGRSQVFARILGDEVILQSIEVPGFTVEFDKTPTEILKSDIHIPELMKVAVSELCDYPPRLLIYVRQHETSNQVSPELQVNGLDRQCRFKLQTIFSVQQNQPKSLTSDAVMQLKPSAAHTEVPVTPNSSPTTISAASLEAESSYLELDDLGEVFDIVESLSSKWKLLATKLRIKPSSLDIIQHNHPGDAVMCLYEVLGEWLKMNYDHQRHGRPSWRRLVDAVRTLDGGLSQRIAEIYVS